MTYVKEFLSVLQFIVEETRWKWVFTVILLVFGLTMAIDMSPLPRVWAILVSMFIGMLILVNIRKEDK